MGLMEENSTEKNVMKEAKRHTSLSTRLPNIDAVRYILFCKKLGTSTSERLRQLALQDMQKPKKHILSGINNIRYNKTSNSYSWIVHLDTGEKVEVLNNLSDNFIQDLKKEIDEAIKERNEWVHHSRPGSVDIPGELVGGEN